MSKIKKQTAGKLTLTVGGGPDTWGLELPNDEYIKVYPTDLDVAKKSLNKQVTISGSENNGAIEGAKIL